MTSLQGHELVVHVFVVADGTDDDRRHLLDLWKACCTRFGLTEAIAPHLWTTPVDVGPTAAPGGVLAARQRPGREVYQAVLRRLRDVVVLSMVCAPGPGTRRGWPELERDWDAVVTATAAPRTLGSARILQARLVDPAATPDAAALAPLVAVASGAAPDPAGGWWDTGTVRHASPYGPFAVWETSAPDTDRTVWDMRADRRIVVVAGADRDAHLSAWTWTRGPAELTPFAHYLTHAAKIRYELRLRAGEPDHDLRATADDAIAPLLRMCEDVAASGREPDARTLIAASAPLVRLQAGSLGLADRAGRLREMRRTVEIAARNMSAHAGSETPSGLFADDASLAAWAALQIDNDVTYLGTTLDRARDVTTLSDQLVQRGLQARRERFNLGLTGVVGAVLMVLAAMQSLKLEFELPRPLLVGVVAGLGALALLVPAILLHLGVPGRRWPALLVALATGAIAGTLPWVGLTALGGDAAAPLVVATSLAVGLLGAGAAWRAARPR